MVSSYVECMPDFCFKSGDTDTCRENWKKELTEYSGDRFLADCDRDRFIDSMRREAEGFWRCAGDGDNEAWLSDVDAIDIKTLKTPTRGRVTRRRVWKSGVEGATKGGGQRNGQRILVRGQRTNMWLCRHKNCIPKKIHNMPRTHLHIYCDLMHGRVVIIILLFFFTHIRFYS